MKLIDAESLKYDMYTTCYETINDEVFWDDGLWVKYDLIEHIINRQNAVNVNKDEQKG